MAHSTDATLAVAALFLVHAGIHAPHTFADAGFSLAAADALVAGSGFSPWSGVPWSQAFDRPLWVVLLAIPGAFGVDTELAAKGLGLGLGLGGLALMGAAVRQLDLRGGWPWLAAAVLAVHPWWTLWTVAASGEVLYTVLLLAGLVRVGVELRAADRVPLGGLLLGVAGVARWDVVVPLLPVGVGILMLSRGRKSRSWVGWTLGCMVVPGLLWVGFRMTLFDALVPTFGRGYQPWPSHSLSVLVRRAVKLVWRPGHDADLVGFAVVAMGLVVALREHRRRPLVVLFGLAGLGELASLVMVGGDWAGTGRRLQVLTMLSVPPVVLAVHWMWGRTHGRGGLRLGLVVLLGWGLLGLGQKSLRAMWSPETSLYSLQRRVAHILNHACAHAIEAPSLADPDPQAWLVETDWPVVDLSGRSGTANPSDPAQVRAALLAADGPTYIHLHGGWARNYQLSRDPRWQADFVEVPGYPIGNGKVHVGTYVRRSALEAGQRRRARLSHLSKPCPDRMAPPNAR